MVNAETRARLREIVRCNIWPAIDVQTALPALLADSEALAALHQSLGEPLDTWVENKELRL